MFNLISLCIGAVALILAVVAFLPLIGWANWFIIPVAVVGLAFGVISSHRSGQNLNLLVIVVGLVRLTLGGGIF